MTKAAHRLSVWLAEKRLLKKDFATMIDVSIWELSRYMNGAKDPPADVRTRIENATGGKVKVMHWVVRHEVAE